MSSDVSRRAVLQTTRVRTHLKGDGSWIQRSQGNLDTQSDVKCKPEKQLKPKNDSSPESSSVSSSIMPCSQSDASSGLDSSTAPQSTYVMSASRKPVRSTENTPVKSGSHLDKSSYTVLEESKRAHADDTTVKPVEEPLKTPADAPVNYIMEKPKVKPVEEPLKTPVDALKKDVGEKPKVKPVEEPLKTPTDSPVKDIVEKPKVKPVEEPLKTPVDALKKDVGEKPMVKVKPLKTPDALKKNVAEKPMVKVKPVDKPLKTPADALKKDVEEKPTVKPSDAPKKDIVENKHSDKPAKEPLKNPADTPAGKTTREVVSTDQRKFSGALQEKTAKTLHENPSKPSDSLITEKKAENPVEQLTMAHAPVVETPLKLKQAENHPTSNHEEPLPLPALKPSTLNSYAATEPIEEPLVKAPVEQHRLNSEAGLNVKGKTMCSFCKLPLNGNVKITINIPDICCHPDCFKCNGCSVPLGDLSSSMFHSAGKVLCERCFDQIFQL